MLPFLYNHDYVFALKKPFFIRLNVGDIVLFEKEPYGVLIKKIESISNKKATVLGSGTYSTDSRVFGSIPLDTVFAKVIFKVPSPH